MGSCCDGMDVRGPLRGELMMGQDDNAAAGWAAEQAGVPKRRGLPRQPVVPPVAEPANEAQTHQIGSARALWSLTAAGWHSTPLGPFSDEGRTDTRRRQEGTTAHRGRISSGTLSAGVLAEAVKGDRPTAFRASE